jgi:ribosomal protein L9
LEKQKIKKIQEDLILEEKVQKIYDKINNSVFSFTLKKDERSEPFGSVGFKEILAELEKMDFLCQKNQLLDFSPLNKLGENIIKVKLSNKLIANLKIVIK